MYWNAVEMGNRSKAEGNQDSSCCALECGWSWQRKRRKETEGFSYYARIRSLSGIYKSDKNVNKFSKKYEQVFQMACVIAINNMDKLSE